MFTKRITIKTELTFKKVLDKLRKGINNDYFLPNKIMSGSINGTRIIGIINSPIIHFYAFKTVVKGDIIVEEDKIDLQFMLSISTVCKVFSFLWSCFSVLISISILSRDDFHNSLETLLIGSTLCLFPLAVFQLILIWDKSRLEEWLRENFKEQNQA